MPKTIRRALYRKLQELPEMSEFQRDFELVSGMKLAFLDELGLGDDLNHASSPMCHALQASREGRAMCARSRHALLAEVGKKPRCLTCDAGLNESVVPLNVGGIRAGYFVFGGIRALPTDPGAPGLITRKLCKNGIPIAETRLKEDFLATRGVARPTLDACQRLVLLFARQLAQKLTDHHGEPDASMPPMVLKACRFIRAHALIDYINLTEVAKNCGVSTGHLSRLFHHSTGLTFREYLARVRVDNARNLLLRTRRNVTEIAYDSGFQSLSQFHRVFLKAFGMTPGKLRSSGKFSTR